MQNKFGGVTPRNFNSMSVAGLSDEARKSRRKVIDSMRQVLGERCHAPPRFCPHVVACALCGRIGADSDVR
jgi:hypothetical protein